MCLRTSAVFALAAWPLIAQQPPGPAEDILALSRDKEAALGKHLAADIRRRSTLIEGVTVQNYLDRLGQRIAAQNEAEFAGMLAHAMVHIAKRHGIRSATRNATSGAVPLIFLGGWAGGCSELVPLALRESHRSNELEADVLAIGALANAGLDPQALWRYIELVPDGARDQRLAMMSSTLEKLPPASLRRLLAR